MNNEGNSFNENPQMNNYQQVQYQQPTPVTNEQYTKPPKRSNALVAILLLLVIGLAGFIAYDKYFKEQEPVKQDNNQTDKVKVEEYIATIDNNTMTGANSVIRLPRIVGNTKTINQLNKKIQSSLIDSYIFEVDELINFLDEKTSDDFTTKEVLVDEIDNIISCFRNVSVTYETYEKNGILVISLVENRCTGASGPFDNTDKFYFYDIANDKELDYIEAAEKFGAKIDNLIEDENGNELTPCKTYKDLKQNDGRYGIIIDIYDNNKMTVTCGRNESWTY